MVKFHGVDVAKVLNRELGGGMRDPVFAVTLTHYTEGTRTTGALTAGTNPTSTTHTATGFEDDYADGQIDGTLVKQGDRIVTILGASLSPATVPEAGDEVSINGRAYRVIRVARDPLQATYECQARGL